MDFILRQKLEACIIAVIHITALFLYIFSHSFGVNIIFAGVTGYLAFYLCIYSLATIRVDDMEDNYGSLLDYLPVIIIFITYLIVLWWL